MITFTPSVVPSQGSGFKGKATVTEIELGDGYVHRVPNAVNGAKRSTDLKWDKITEAQKKELDDFFTAMGGAIPFKYTLPGELVAHAYVCKDWGAVSTDGGHNFTAELIETFDFS